ncbi:sensor histidine kinase [bacterium C-53]|nr:sensor histidine kinase [Lachnospiraceae bacterium]NBI02263.1 sensor histidine kinase [Lachnospiraceae bacterium]RKJ11830.1 sensor histidine kinase [bacterium C-53]
MERIKQMNLKKALFTITFFNITIALILSLLSVWGCVTLRSQIAPSGIVVEIRSNSVVMNQLPERTAQAAAIDEIISVIQMILPILIYIGALFITVSMFYCLKLKEPLALLTKGASRIIENDLDFTIEAESQDELGQLCTAFETMRKTLLDNNRELWRQAEERKRLNAAFSHDLRNPVTVLKGSAKLAEKSVMDGTGSPEQIAGHLSRIERYTGRIERYIETMSSIQRLEEIPIQQEQAEWDNLISELEATITFVGADSSKRIKFNSSTSAKSLSIDKSILFQIAENLISNAIRFAAQTIYVSCSLNETVLKLSVTDDGCGFPAALIKNGIQPFQKGSKDTEHFGMGLYICNLLCQRHGGSISVQNHKIGATVSATLKIQ